MKYLIVKPQDKKNTKDLGYIKVQQLLNQEDVENLSAAIIEIDGTNKKIINRKGDAIYYILEGNGYFEINGIKNAVEKGDLVFIPKGCEYFDSGKLKMICINSPRYDSNFIKYVD